MCTSPRAVNLIAFAGEVQQDLAQGPPIRGNDQFAFSNELLESKAPELMTDFVPITEPLSAPTATRMIQLAVFMPAPYHGYTVRA
jgi:hypothetical protein